MTLLRNLWHQFWRDLMHDNQLATAEHKQCNKQTAMQHNRKKKPKGWQRCK